MLNQIILVGRVCFTEEIIDKGIKTIRVVLSVVRSTSSIAHDPSSDLIPVHLTNYLTTKGSGALLKGNLLGVKGRLVRDGDFIYVLAEKLTFLQGDDAK